MSGKDDRVGQRRRLTMTGGLLQLPKPDPVTVWREEEWDGQRWGLVAQADSEQCLNELLGQG